MYVQQNKNAININEIKSVINSLTNSATDYDEMPAAIMKQLINCEASLQNPQNVAQNEMVVILDYNLISLNKQ